MRNRSTALWPGQWRHYQNKCV